MKMGASQNFFRTRRKLQNSRRMEILDMAATSSGDSLEARADSFEARAAELRRGRTSIRDSLEARVGGMRDKRPPVTAVRESTTRTIQQGFFRRTNV